MNSDAQKDESLSDKSVVQKVNYYCSIVFKIVYKLSDTLSEEQNAASRGRQIVNEIKKATDFLLINRRKKIQEQIRVVV